MVLALQNLSDRLKQARLAKGLSQRELSEITGLVQAQISRIEAGTVDPRLSTLVTLAHALDLELELVPRKALPAVKSLSRQISGAHSELNGRQAKLRRRLEETLRDLQRRFPEVPLNQRLRIALSELAQQGGAARAVKALQRAGRSLKKVEDADQLHAAFEKALHELEKAAQSDRVMPQGADPHHKPRAAWTLDGEDDA